MHQLFVDIFRNTSLPAGSYAQLLRFFHHASPIALLIQLLPTVNAV